MLDRLRLPETLVPRLAEAARAAAVRGGDGLLSVTAALPSWDGRLPAAAVEPFCYRAEGAARRALLGLGEAWAVEAAGPARLGTLDGAVRALGARWRHLDLDGTGLEPGALAGFAFDPLDPMAGRWQGWPNALVVVPRVLLQRRHEACAVTLTLAPGEIDQAEVAVDRWLAPARPILEGLRGLSREGRERTEPDRLDGEAERAAWLALVREGRDAVAAGGLRKVVPVREVMVRTRRPPAPDRLLTGLEQRYARCAVWALSRGEGLLVAASPERLVGLHAGQVVSDALGGTAPTGGCPDLPGAMPPLASEKVRHEHALVVEAIREALAPYVDGLAAGATPEVVTLRNLAHLRTVFRGRAREGATLLGLAGRLHPTPAVCGLPQADALGWLRARGNAGRGWYTGAIGWVDRRGDGELSVVLRCGLLQGRAAALFAGAGVVEGSDPQAELAETELKLCGLLEALGSA
jgi:isochorismate synthase